MIGFADLVGDVVPDVEGVPETTNTIRCIAAAAAAAAQRWALRRTERQKSRGSKKRSMWQRRHKFQHVVLEGPCSRNSRYSKSSRSRQSHTKSQPLSTTGVHTYVHTATTTHHHTRERKKWTGNTYPPTITPEPSPSTHTQASTHQTTHTHEKSSSITPPKSLPPKPPQHHQTNIAPLYTTYGISL